jgi:penicillin-binding protein 1A
MDLRSPVRQSSGATVPPPRRRRRTRRSLVVGCLLASAAAAGLVGFAAVTSPPLGDPQAVVSERLTATGGRFVPLPGIAPVMRQAVVAAEDERFWGHHGIDTIGIARAVAYDASHLSLSQGASTITEQLAKQLYLEGNDRSPIRKVQDAILAFKLESVLSKNQILAAYLNTVYFGEGATGVGAASARYFGAPPSSLTLAQASLLAGVIRSPTADDPLIDPAAARARQGSVLRAMVGAGDVTRAQAERAIRDPLPLASGRTLASATGITVSPPPAVSVSLLVFGALLAITGVVFVIVRRRRWLTLAGWVVTAMGLLAEARAIHRD